jgi:hypothetical protein
MNEYQLTINFLGVFRIFHVESFNFLREMFQLSAGKVFSSLGERRKGMVFYQNKTVVFLFFFSGYLLFLQLIPLLHIRSALAP